MSLQVARGLALPVDTIVDKKAILAKTGAGKSTTACGYVEEVLDQGVQVVIIDPKGDWWGVRSSSDGKKKGYPVVVMGGDHADVPIDPQAGESMGRYLAENPVSFILDVSEFTQGEIHRFVADFMTEFYRAKKKNKTPVLVVVAEADEVAPQQVNTAFGKDLPRCVGAVQRVVKRGRFLGIGTLVETQRSASLNKDVLTQSDILIVMRTSAPQDLKAIKGWIENHPDVAKQKEIMGNLQSLKTGEGYVWAPEYDIFKRVKFRRRRTFDAGKTPKIGEKPVEPKVLAPVELEALRGQMEDFVRQKEQADPANLKKRIKQLEKELAARPEPEAVVTERPVLTDEDRETLRRMLDIPREVADLGDELANQFAQRLEVLVERTALSDEIHEKLRQATNAVINQPRPRHGGHNGTSRRPKSKPTPPTRASPAEPEGLAGDVPPDLQDEITPARVRLLDALARLEAVGATVVPKNQLAAFAGASPKSSSFSNNVSRLRVLGLVNYPSRGSVGLTEQGRAVVGPVTVATVEELHARIEELVSPARWRILSVLIGQYPGSLDKEDLAAAVGASPTSSAFANNVSALRTLGFVDYPSRGSVVATPLLFLEVVA